LHRKTSSILSGENIITAHNFFYNKVDFCFEIRIFMGLGQAAVGGHAKEDTA